MNTEPYYRNMYYLAEIVCRTTSAVSGLVFDPRDLKSMKRSTGREEHGSLCRIVHGYSRVIELKPDTKHSGVPILTREKDVAAGLVDVDRLVGTVFSR